MKTKVLFEYLAEKQVLPDGSMCGRTTGNLAELKGNAAFSANAEPAHVSSFSKLSYEDV